MRSISITEQAVFGADAAVVYGILADYREGHPAILPRRFFTGLEVERGGYGAGTVIRFGMKLGGRVVTAVADVEEPKPGRVLVERVRDERDTVTTFTVEPLEGGRVQVTIHTTWQGRGVSGLIERLVAPALLGRIYREELGNLEMRAQAPRSG